MKKNLAFIISFFFVNLLHAQPIDYDNLPKEYQDVAIRAFASIKPSTKKWVEETAQKHPPGKFDKNWVNGQVASFTGGASPVDNLWAVMLAYQKMLNKEAREERKTSRSDAAVEVKLKENKMALDNTKIDQQKQEANERYNNSMQAANTQSSTGISSSSTQVTNNKAQVKQDSLKQKTATGGESKDATEASRDRRRAVQDNIQKMLDQIGEWQRSGRF